MNPRFFDTLLRELDPVEAASHSTINHHARGLDYLCLHRSPKLTVKLYIISPEACENDVGEHLLAPHSHRYKFDTIVLGGAVAHVKFYTKPGSGYTEYEYHPELRQTAKLRDVDLDPYSATRHNARGQYFVSPHEVHTLLVPREQTILGLVQYGDTRETSTVYLPSGAPAALKYPDSRKPTVAEVYAMRDLVLSRRGH